MYLRTDENETLPAVEQVTAVAKLLMKAKGLLEERGWCQGVLCARDGAVCSRGALYVAAGARAVPGNVSAHDFTWPQHILVGQADEALQAATGSKQPVPLWNDAIGRKKQEVLAVFDKAIAAERARR